MSSSGGEIQELRNLKWNHREVWEETCILQMQYLSTGDKLTLINSVPDSIPTYFMSLFPISKKVEHKLDRIRRNFLWDGSNNSHKFHLVKWDQVIQPKSRVGLAIRDLGINNKCLLMKWLWRYATTDSSLWKEVIKAKHRMMDNWSSKIANALYGWEHGNTWAN